MVIVKKGELAVFMSVLFKRHCQASAHSVDEVFFNFLCVFKANAIERGSMSSNNIIITIQHKRAALSAFLRE